MISVIIFGCVHALTPVSYIQIFPLALILKYIRLCSSVRVRSHFTSSKKAGKIIVLSILILDFYVGDEKIKDSKQTGNRHFPNLNLPLI
jgi:hypothetical protein